MLDSLAPARRRLVVASVVLAAIGVIGAVATTLLTRDPPVGRVDQAHAGPVLLVPGYGGSTSALEELSAALERSGRRTVIVRSPGEGTGDLREHARALAEAATAEIDGGAPSVDVVGYSAGGVVVRLWVRELGGAGQARRVVSLASPQHGTDLAALASELSSRSCPVACRQLAPESDLLRHLNAGDETPEGPRWVAIWNEDDATVVPPSSGALDGATSYSAQSVCPGLHVAHADLPRSPTIQAMVLSALSGTRPVAPSRSDCRPRRAGVSR